MSDDEIYRRLKTLGAIGAVALLVLWVALLVAL